MHKNILLINGPNLNMLGVRRPEIYGRETLVDIENGLSLFAKEAGYELSCFQSNYEGAIIDKIQSALGIYDGIIINPGAYTHYSYAIHDALESVSLPCVEIHISDIHSREEFRRISVTAPACIEQISGHGTRGYFMAFTALTNYIESGVSK